MDMQPIAHYLKLSSYFFIYKKKFINFVQKLLNFIVKLLCHIERDLLRKNYGQQRIMALTKNL